MAILKKPKEHWNDDENVVVCLVRSARGGVSGELTRADDVSEVRFDAKEAPALPVGSEVKLEFRHPQLREPLDTVACVHHRRYEGLSCYYGFEFLNQQAIISKLTRLLDRIKNRRGALRLWPPFDQPVPVTIEHCGGLVPPSQGRLVDISVSGTGISVKADTEKAFAGTNFVVVSFCLPGIPEPLSLHGAIVNRKTQGLRVRYGIRFDEERTPTFAQAYQIISQYVMRRQLEVHRKTD